MHSLTIYGFGSAFGLTETGDDIDLLILHENSDPTSCQLAIQCKRQLSNRISDAHITMLSASEEAQFQFIKSARAVRLGLIREAHVSSDIADLCSSHLQLIAREPEN